MVDIQGIFTEMIFVSIIIFSLLLPIASIVLLNRKYKSLSLDPKANLLLLTVCAAVLTGLVIWQAILVQGWVLFNFKLESYLPLRLDLMPDVIYMSVTWLISVVAWVYYCVSSSFDEAISIFIKAIIGSLVLAAVYVFILNVFFN